MNPALIADDGIAALLRTTLMRVLSRFRIVSCLLAALVLSTGILLAGCSSLSKTPPADVDLTGVWRLDEAASDDAAKVLAALRPKDGGRHHRRRDGGDPTVDQPLPGQGPGARRGIGSTLMAKELDIDQRDTETRIEFDGREIVIFRWGEQSRRHREFESGWQGERFVVLSRGRIGPDVERVFSVSPRGDQLTVTTSVDDEEIRQVYLLDVATTGKVYPSR